MAKSTITRERLAKIKSWRETYGAGSNVMLPSEEAEELARIALAAMDGEPVAEVYQPQNAGICAPLGPSIRMLCLLEPGEKLYRHAQPAPSSESITVTDDMAYAFHHALTDSMIGADDVEEIKTGLRAVFANLTAPVVSAEYPDRLPCSVLLEPGLRFGKGIKTSTMLAALARRAVYESDMAALSPEERAEFQARIEDFKALIAQPVPVVPQDVLEALQKVARIRLDMNDFDGDRRGIADCLGDAEEALIEVVNRRAAMLAAAPQSPGSEPATVPGKWIPVSEQMPEKNQNVLISVNFDSDLVEPLICSARYTGSTFRRGDATVKPGTGIEEATHWMPLPAAPQEAVNELIPLVSRNEREVK